MVGPEVAAWALARMRADAGVAAQIEREISRRYPNMKPDERVLRAEPVSIGAAVLSIFGITGASTAVAGLVGSALLIAGSIGLQYAAAALRGNGVAPLSNETTLNDSVKYNERQAIPSKRIPYGTVQMGGALFFEDVKPPYLYQGILLSAKQITAIKKIWIGTTELSFTALTPNTILTPRAIDGQPDYPGNLRVSVRLGTAGQTIDPILAADFPNLASSFRQRGIATAVFRYNFGGNADGFTRLWGQVQRPNPLLLVQGVAVPDPRKPGHILDWNPDDPASLAAAEATWEWSDNASLIQAHYLTQRYGGRIKPSRMNWDKVAIGAEWDDGLIGCLDGALIKRHTINGVVTLNQSPSRVLAGMLTANRGFVLESAGRTWVSSSAPRTPVATIYDAILTGAVEFRSDKPRRDKINRVKTEFVAEDREYQTTVGPILSRTDLQAIDGEILDGPLSLPFTVDHRRSQRLADAFLETGRLGATLSVRCDVLLLANCSDELVGNTVNFDSKLFAQCNGVYFVQWWGFVDSYSSIEIFLTEYNPAIETGWQATTDEQPFALTPLNVS